MTGSIHETLCTFMIIYLFMISLLIVLEKKNVSDKICVQKTHILCSPTPPPLPPKIVPLMR